jgi:hypothetical protein
MSLVTIAISFACLLSCAGAPDTTPTSTNAIDPKIDELIKAYVNIPIEQNRDVLTEIYAPNASYYMDYITGYQEIQNGEGSRRLIGRWWQRVIQSTENHSITLHEIIAQDEDTAVAKLKSTAYSVQLGADLVGDITLNLVRSEGQWMIQDERVICEEAVTE